ncbi:hypothetical protein CEXT_551191 [Caerostris extrusa]|uniref:Uncharacterized protein n=1 Tax=Caerostris extrusa TaxID=172846 RepID=A0AAV4XSQ8_CAEEX|nr:hypothetical protein CEXT_551191 [Caerostris extrusa]
MPFPCRSISVIGASRRPFCAFREQSRTQLSQSFGRNKRKSCAAFATVRFPSLMVKISTLFFLPFSSSSSLLRRFEELPYLEEFLPQVHLSSH